VVLSGGYCNTGPSGSRMNHRTMLLVVVPIPKLVTVYRLMRTTSSTTGTSLTTGTTGSFPTTGSSIEMTESRECMHDIGFA
jgi:hypothetical protein